MRANFLLILLFIVACNDSSINTKKQNIQFSDKYIVCDTCNSTIIVHHDACTICGEISVDSGTVFITSDILSAIDTLAINSNNLDSFLVSPNIVSLRELYFTDHDYFKKLWKDTINFQDIYKAFRLTGKVTEIKRRVLDNGVIVTYPSLFFKVYKAEEIDTAYLRKIRK
jgi:hypothetical protein